LRAAARHLRGGKVAAFWQPSHAWIAAITVALVVKADDAGGAIVDPLVNHVLAPLWAHFRAKKA
jgi:hypothetical protein